MRERQGSGAGVVVEQVGGAVRSLDGVAEGRREVALEIERLAEEFERSDEAAFRRGRVVCWVVTAAVTALVLVLMLAGGDWRYLGAFWVVIVGVCWVGYGLSSRRQRQQTARLRALAMRWLEGVARVGS